MSTQKPKVPRFILFYCGIIPMTVIMWSHTTKQSIASIFPELSGGMIGALNALFAMIFGVIIGFIALIVYMKYTRYKQQKLDKPKS